MVSYLNREKKLDSLVGRRPVAPTAPKGIYLYGNVGSGMARYIYYRVSRKKPFMLSHLSFSLYQFNILSCFYFELINPSMRGSIMSFQNILIPKILSYYLLSIITPRSCHVWRKLFWRFFFCVFLLSNIMSLKISYEILRKYDSSFSFYSSQ